jgi:hypothetical protein
MQESACAMGPYTRKCSHEKDFSEMILDVAPLNVWPPMSRGAHY